MISAINVARLLHVCGRIDGRKKLQKIVYILQQMGFKQDFPHAFGYLYWGPYSRQLKQEIDWLSCSGTGLIEEEEHHPAPDPRAVTYSYKPKDELGNVLKELGMGEKPAWENHAVRLARIDAQKLEAIATIIYLRRKGLPKHEVEKQFRSLKPGLVGHFHAASDEASRLVPTP